MEIERAGTTNRLLLAAVVGSSLLLSGAATAQNFQLDPALIEQANAEGSVNYYNAQDPTVTEATIAAFEKAYPDITVNALRPGASSVLIARFMQEVNAGVHTADVINTQASVLFLQHPEWFQKITPELLPTLAAAPEAINQGSYVRTLQSPFVFAYNHESLDPADVPQTWEDLLDPKLKGRGVMADPRASDNYLHWLDLMAKTYGDDFLVKLRDQEIRVVAGGAQGAQEIAAGGSGPVFMVALNIPHAQPLIDKGAPITVVKDLFQKSDMPPLVNHSSFGIPLEAPHSAAARVFLSWLISVEGQRANCTAFATASIVLNDSNRGDCPAPLTVPVHAADDPVDPSRKAHLLGLIGLD